MAGMNMDLASMYGTAGATEEQEKLAEMELFAKLASEQGIDLNTLSDEQVAELYTSVFSKTASENGMCPKCHQPEAKCKCTAPDEKKAEAEAAAAAEAEKVAAAEAEFAATQEFKEKVAEMDYLGRVMAHSFAQETKLIKEAADKLAKEEKPEDKKPEDKKNDGDADDKGKNKFPSHLFGKKDEKAKESSAIDALAIKSALSKLAEAGADVVVGEARLNAVNTLGLGASEKIASAANVAGAVEIRSLEFLEAAGYPVEWAK